MKIYNKIRFIWGILFFGEVLLLLRGNIRAELHQAIVFMVLSVYFLYTSLSKEEYERQKKVKERYTVTARKLFGKYATIKTNLPWIITASFFAVALFLRLIFDITLPIWSHACFVVVLTIAAFYSIGLDKAIKEEIERSE